MTFNEWANKWNVSEGALVDFYQMVGIDLSGQNSQSDTPEAKVQQNVRLGASRSGANLMRNNVGAGKLENGRFMRWGLANESEKMNKVTKSSDLIGIKPVVVTPVMVGRTIGQFCARETKRANWKFSGTPEEQAQLTFINFINSRGGDAKFTTRGFE